jgi:hypothetical protein
MPHHTSHVIAVPTNYVLVVANAFTQFLCVRGANLLMSASSSLTVCIVLSFRKLLSLLISTWLFGISVELGFLVGTAVVFGSVLVYALDDWRRLNGNVKV